MATESTTKNLETPDLPDNQTDYKAPAKKTLDDISKLDADDPSLVKYKQALLGNMDEVAFDKDDPRKVIVTSVEIHSPELEKPKVITVNSKGDGDSKGQSVKVACRLTGWSFFFLSC